MIRTILVYDNEDITLGNFFQKCASKCRYLYNIHFNQNVIMEHKSNSNKNEIEISISKYNDNRFLLICYLHGDNDSIYLSNEKIVSKDNASLFINAFCYTFSCCCGKDLSRILLDNRALIFWGYRGEAYVVLGYEEVFAELAVLGLSYFFKNESIENAYYKTQEEHIKLIDTIYQENLFVAAHILDNKDAMVIYGNNGMTISDFII